MHVATLSGITRRAGGVCYAVASLCKALDALGTHVSVLGARDRFFHEDLPLWGSVDVLPYRAFGPLGSSMELRRMLARCHPDVVHQNGLWQDDQWAALQWQEMGNGPTVVSPHGMLDPWAVKNSRWKKKLVGRLFANKSLEKATCIHALCQSEVGSIRAYGLKNPIALIPNGVDLPSPRTLGSKLQTEGKQLLFLGRIHPKKGLAELLQGWAKARSLNPKAFSEWKLLIAGWDDGEHEQGLRALAGELGVGDSVDFTGPHFGAEKEALLRSVDAFVLPSFSEGLPMSVLEAWAFRLPVVMTGFCNLPEGFKADAAIRIEPRPEHIAQGLGQLVDLSRDGLERMGARGRALVEERFAWPQIAQEMKAVHEWCLGGDKPACLIED